MTETLTRETAAAAAAPLEARPLNADEVAPAIAPSVPAFEVAAATGATAAPVTIPEISDEELDQIIQDVTAMSGELFAARADESEAKKRKDGYAKQMQSRLADLGRSVSIDRGPLLLTWTSEGTDLVTVPDEAKIRQEAPEAIALVLRLKGELASAEAALAELRQKHTKLGRVPRPAKLYVAPMRKPKAEKKPVAKKVSK
ncbi:hypothetical protein [Leucobacter sp. cx-169]|uniref:hypothetical protein n=1 Tax=Leucobacter sp. cx-169 TaxID=2770549 RepID=UPI00165D44EA|nr:hypothetical protein [Leucobacter sp. cx-169]MBC9927349.1 hypothetical protein [Leucobacter sp. cx-169]